MSRKVSKKEIRSNALLDQIVEMQNYIKERKTTTLIVVGIILVLAIGIPSAMFYKKSINLKAINHLDNGLAYFERARLSGGTSIDSYQKSLEEFQIIINNYALSSLTPMALLYMGNTFYQMDNYPEAKRAYTRFLKKYPNHSLAGLAQKGVATSTEMLKEFQNAVIEYQKLNQSYPHLITDDIQLSEAHCYEELQRFEEAVNIYDQLGADNFLARLRLARINNKKKT